MNKVSYACLALVFALCISACTTVTGPAALADASETSLKSQLISGVTTTDDVTRMYGHAAVVNVQLNGQIVWHYVYAKVHNDPFTSYEAMVGKTSSNTSKALDILFSAKGVLVSYSLQIQ